jgi:pimeloyl-ACP methyl ester carboxylesterase
MHSYRILMASERERRPLKHIFLINNGLNELDKLGLYYRLASYIIDNEPDAACVLRPFPSHLSRSAYALAFAETPLQRYLWDGSHLFQQFLRYMVETRWFLSALVRRSRYPSKVGVRLLQPADDPDTSRVNATVLAEALSGEFTQMQEASNEGMALIKTDQTLARPIVQKAPPMPTIVSSVTALRDVLGLDLYPAIRGNDPVRPEAQEPALHVIGYSLGGFVAQSMFMSWPSLIASCSTLLSGGALRELAPTAFADPEEWQTVLHSLRYEFDDALSTRRFSSAPDFPAGVAANQFYHYKRIFYEVFQQDYGGSFRSRVSAYRRRLLFVVGGDDSIVRPTAVRQSAPPGGINLVEVGGMSHFLEKRAGVEEAAQRTFWLPQIGRIIAEFAADTESQLLDERVDSWGNSSTSPQLAPPSDPRRKRRSSETDVLRDIPADGALSSRLFENCLDDMLARLGDTPSQTDNADEQGSRSNEQGEARYLLISRNEPPAVLLDPATVEERARATHHDELSILRYCAQTAKRSAQIERAKDRVVLLVPWNAERLVRHLDPDHGFPGQSETASGYLTSRTDRASVIWKEFDKRCKEIQRHTSRQAVYQYDGRAAHNKPPPPSDSWRSRLFEQSLSKATGSGLTVPSLPDCWILISNRFLESLAGPGGPQRREQYSVVTDLARKVSALNDPNLGEEHDAAWNTLESSLKNGDVRILSISRARYNPRYRGRLATNLRQAHEVLTHAALCAMLSRAYPQRTARRAAPPANAAKVPAPVNRRTRKRR